MARRAEARPGGAAGAGQVLTKAWRRPDVAPYRLSIVRYRVLEWSWAKCRGFFRSFAKEPGNYLLWSASPPQKSTRQQQQHFIYHNSFSLTTTKSTPKPNNHGRLQRRRRSASSPGCLPGTYLASSSSVFDSASRQTTPLTDMSKLPSCHGEENRAPRTICLSGHCHLATTRASLQSSDFYANEYPSKRG